MRVAVASHVSFRSLRIAMPPEAEYTTVPMYVSCLHPEYKPSRPFLSPVMPQLVEDPKLDAAPVNLTELRKAGLTRACELAETDPSAVVESCFEVWRKERHNVEPHLFPGVLETLAALRERGVRLVAITNGNAQTDDIPCLKDLFEFCVMAEEVCACVFVCVYVCLCVCVVCKLQGGVGRVRVYFGCF